MLRSLCAGLAALSIIVSSTTGAMAASMYGSSVDPLYGLLDDNEMAGMAYVKIPFGGRGSKPHEATYGFSLVSKLPYEYSHAQFGNRRGMATLMDFQFTGRGLDDMRMNGYSAKQSYRQMNAFGDETSPWVTFGLMALAIGATVAIIVLVGDDNEDNPIPREPGRAQGPGCGRFGNPGSGLGDGDGQGDGTLGINDPRLAINDEGVNSCDEPLDMGGDGEGDGGGDGGG